MHICIYTFIHSIICIYVHRYSQYKYVCLFLVFVVNARFVCMNCVSCSYVCTYRFNIGILITQLSFHVDNMSMSVW